MENRINIAELLKDCPKGMELYSPLCGECRVLNIYDRLGFDVICGDDTIYNFSYDGRYNIMGECCIFPSKENRDWSKFQRPFKDGDIVTCTNEYCTYIAIFKEMKDNNSFYRHAVTYNDEFCCVSNDWSDFNETCRIATEEEKQKLFDAIKANGYKWNEETKTLEKLIKPWTIQDAKDGDVLAFNDETIVIFKDLYNKTSFHSYCHIEDGIFTISKKDMPDWWEGRGFYPATEEQHDFLFQKIKEAGYKWNPESKTLSKLVQHNFEVGNKIEKCGYSFIIAEVKDDYYLTKCGNKIPIDYQDDFSLVPNKFDITNLKPFDKVLIKCMDCKWKIAFYGYYDKDLQYPFVCTNGDTYDECIPYNDETEHLLGTTKDCDEYYKTWE